MPKIGVNHIELDYTDLGQGTPLVLLHGLGSTKADWEAQLPAFADAYRLIVPDLRGHGATTKTDCEFGVNHMAQDIVELLDKLNIPQASFVGFSMGGAVAFELAHTHPNLIDKLIIVNSGPDFNAMGHFGESLLESRTRRLQELGMAQLAAEISQNMFPDPEQVLLRQSFTERCAANLPEAYLKSFTTLMAWGMGERLQDIPHKTLVVASDMDYTPISFKESYVARMQQAELAVISNSRHGVVLDQPEEFNTTVLKFLQDA
jgi:pimeloyl-ACP methyl ester carboxylesterase